MPLNHNASVPPLTPVPLPQAQRTAILLTKVDGLSVSEAAERTGASESAIKVQVHRGLKRLAARVRALP